MEAAHEPLIIGSMAGPTLDCAAVLDDLLRLGGTSAPPLEDVERVLTNGYACVLRTEGERRRLHGRLVERAANLGATPDPQEVVEIKVLAQGITRADADVEALRTALHDLAAARAGRLRVP